MQSTETILTILVAVIAAFGFVQMLILAGMFLAMRKALKASGEYANELKTKVNPIIQETTEVLATTKGVIRRLEPKLEAAAGDLADMTKTASTEVRRISAHVEDLADRAKRQAERVDGMTTNALNGVDKVGHFLNEAVNMPARQMSGVVAAARAVMQTLRRPAPSSRPAPHVMTPREERIRQERQAAVR